MTKPASVLLALIPALALACSDFATAPDREPAEFRMTPASALVTEGETITFEYTVLDQDGEEYAAIPRWAAPLWTYSDGRILEVDATGRGLALGPGEVRAVAQMAGLEAETVVRVNPSALHVTVPFAYITQSVQRPAGDVPLVAGREGLLRVYLQGGLPNFFEPRVVATFHRDGAVIHTEVLESGSGGIPQLVREGDRQLSYDALIPGTVLQPGTGMVLEVDPDGVVPAASSSTLRIPATGTRALDIVEVPPFRVRLVPVVPSQTGRSSSFTVDNMALRTRLAADVFPLGEVDVDLREPYVTDAQLDTEEGWYQLIEEVAVLRLDDASDRYYYGGFQPPHGVRLLGLGYVGYPVSIGVDYSSHTIAHEIGHNLSLPHAPCGDPAGADPNYPYASGKTGRFGYDRSNDYLYDPDDTFDLMSYCDPAWISDYNYERVLAYRDSSEFDAAFDAAAAPAPRGEVLIVSGGVLNGRPRLGPALTSSAPPTTPAADSRYVLEGLAADGAVLFRWRLEPRPLDHGNGAIFTVAIPGDVARPDRLATLRLTGPEGVAARGRAPQAARPGVELRDGRASGGAAEARWDASLFPLAVARDRATGRILAMSRTGRLTLPGDPSQMDVMVSDGVGTRRVDLEQR